MTGEVYDVRLLLVQVLEHVVGSNRPRAGEFQSLAMLGRPDASCDFPVFLVKAQATAIRGRHSQEQQTNLRDEPTLRLSISSPLGDLAKPLGEKVLNVLLPCHGYPPAPLAPVGRTSVNELARLPQKIAYVDSPRAGHTCVSEPRPDVGGGQANGVLRLLGVVQRNQASLAIRRGRS